MISRDLIESQRLPSDLRQSQERRLLRRLESGAFHFDWLHGHGYPSHSFSNAPTAA